MKTYTEEQVEQVIKYACEYQKAECYQHVGGILLEDDYETTDSDIKCLDYLANNEIVDHEIDLEEIFDKQS